MALTHCRTFFFKSLFAFLFTAGFNFQAFAHTVVPTQNSAKPIANIVKQILPHTTIPTDTKVTVAPNQLVDTAWITEVTDGIQIHYNQNFENEVASSPVAPLDVWMLLTLEIGKFTEWKSPAFLVGKVMALEGFSKSLVLSNSEKIKSQNLPWLNSTQMKELLQGFTWYRNELLNPLGNYDPDQDLSAGIVLAEPVMEEAAPVEPNNSVVKVYYATNRQKYPLLPGKTSEDWVDPNEFFNGIREEGSTVHYGYTLVNIPKVHEKGKLERPSVVQLKFWGRDAENPDKHVMLTDIKELDKDSYFDTLKEESKDAKTAFVFVHGFNVNFDSAARVTAQLSFDSEFQGTPILFSWPSDGNPAMYTSDQTDAKLGGLRLKDFLFDLVEKSGYETINLVAHSMGNLAMTEALFAFESEMFKRVVKNEAPVLKGLLESDSKPFTELVMYAPDVDVDIFEEQLNVIPNVVDHTSVYSSNNDKAITFSTELRSGAPRLGGYVVQFDTPKNCRGGLMYSNTAIDSIDATDVNLGLFSPLNHSYYSEFGFVDDFGKLMSGKKRMQKPKNRGLGRQIVEEHEGDEYRFWGFIPCK